MTSGEWAACDPHSGEEDPLGDDETLCSRHGDHLDLVEKWGHWYCEVCGAEWSDEEDEVEDAVK